MEKLDDAHKTHTRSLQDTNNQEKIRELQLSQLSSNLRQLKIMGERSTAVLILESLHYQRMEAREEKIIDAHAQTFEWIFDPYISSSRLPSKDNFVEWLANGNDIFWIAGKAGSGKSTLMKFLSHHESTRSALQQWADGKRLVTAAFYFWHAGTELQKSQEGLLQSLLYSILSQCPDIMPQVLCKRWEQCARNQSRSGHWTRAELLKAFSELSHQSSLNKRFCFFIDGLDEYDGDHSEIVDLVQSFATAKDVKICLSSRPWNVFTRAFEEGSYPRFYLEDLTRPDIKLYVQDMLGRNTLFRQLAVGKDSARCIRLEDEIVSRAQGVFLWVFLVVRSLIKGLTNADRVADLERRLQSLPTDLEAYFRHMFENIEDIYVQQTVQTFHIALQVEGPLNLMTYAMIDELEECPRYAIELPVQQMTTTEIESRCRDMKLRINARCKDLLQITRKDFQKPSMTSVNELPMIFPYEVDFLHRTVKDFLQIHDVQRFITCRIPETFNYCTLVCHALLAQIKIAPIEIPHFNQCGELSGLVDDLTQYTHQAETQTARPNVELLDELSTVIGIQLDSLYPVFRRVTANPRLCPSIRKLYQTALGFAVQKDLPLYVTNKLDEILQNGSAVWETDVLLFDALEPLKTSYVVDHLHTLKNGVWSKQWTMLRLLVDWFVRLNWSLARYGYLDHILSIVSVPRWTQSENDTRIVILEILTALLKAGAEPISSQAVLLSCVKVFIIPSENWRTGSIEFEAALTRTVVAFCERVIDPYWEFQGRTLWCHFVRSIYDGAPTSTPLSLETTELVLVIIKKFMSLGAQLDDMVYHEVNKYDQGDFVALASLSVSDVLTRLLTKQQLEELELSHRRAVQDGSEVEVSGAQRRRKKKRGKERRENLGS